MDCDTDTTSEGKRTIDAAANPSVSPSSLIATKQRQFEEPSPTKEEDDQVSPRTPTRGENVEGVDELERGSNKEAVEDDDKTPEDIVVPAPPQVKTPVRRIPALENPNKAKSPLKNALNNFKTGFLLMKQPAPKASNATPQPKAEATATPTAPKAPTESTTPTTNEKAKEEPNKAKVENETAASGIGAESQKSSSPTANVASAASKKGSPEKGTSAGFTVKSVMETLLMPQDEYRRKRPKNSSANLALPSLAATKDDQAPLQSPPSSPEGEQVPSAATATTDQELWQEDEDFQRARQAALEAEAKKLELEAKAHQKFEEEKAEEFRLAQKAALEAKALMEKQSAVEQSLQILGEGGGDDPAFPSLLPVQSMMDSIFKGSDDDLDNDGGKEEGSEDEKDESKTAESNEKPTLVGGLFCSLASTGRCMSEEEAHGFEVHTYRKPTNCDICKGLLVGFWNQGLQCRVCGMNVHKGEGVDGHNDCRAEALLHGCQGEGCQLHKRDSSHVPMGEVIQQMRQMAKEKPNFLKEVRAQMDRDINSHVRRIVVSASAEEQRGKSLPRARNAVVPIVAMVDSVEDRGPVFAYALITMAHLGLAAVVGIISWVGFLLALLPKHGIFTSSARELAHTHSTTVMYAYQMSMLILTILLRRLINLMNRKSNPLDQFVREVFKLEAEQDLGVSVKGATRRLRLWINRITAVSVAMALMALLVWQASQPRPEAFLVGEGSGNSVGSCPMDATRFSTQV